MFGWKRFVCVTAMAVVVFGAVKAEAQVDRRQRRMNATRQARIAKTIQDTYSHKWEVFGGGGYLRFRSGEALQKNNEVSWAMAVNRYLNPRWAIVGDVRGHYGDAKVYNNPYNTAYHPLITQYTFMGGAQYRFYRKERLSANIHALGGAALGNFDGGTKGIPAEALGLWKTSTAGAFSVGASMDYSFYPNLAFRLTPTYVLTTFGSKLQHNAGFNVGVVYRFGQQ